MNIRRLEAFLAVARYGGFAEAAGRLNLTQSAISIRIKELEHDLGVVLFNRSKRQVQLTPKGRELIDYAERAVALQHEIRRQVGSPEAMSGVMRIGVAELIAVTWLPRFAAMVRARHPGLILEFDVAMNPSMLGRVRSGDLDIALVISTETAGDLLARDLGVVPFAWMVGASFDLPHGTLSMDDLSRLPIIYQGTDSFMREFVSSMLHFGGKARRSGTSCNSLAALASLTVAGLGVSLMPLQTSERDIREGRLRILPIAPTYIDVGYSAVCARADNSLAVSTLMDIAIEASTFQR